MVAITREQVIKNVPDAWKHQYEPSWVKTIGGDSWEIYNKLRRAKTAEKINKIIGNDGWTRNECDICGEDSTVVVAFTRYENSISVCGKCLKKALEMAVPATKEEEKEP